MIARMLHFRRIIILSAILLLAVACEAQSGLSLAPEWQAESVASWQDELPDMLAFSRDGNTLFVSCETTVNMLSPSLVRIDLKTGEKQTMLYGLNRADGLKMDWNGDLWLGEEVPDGLIIHVASPADIAPEQRLDRERLIGSHRDITPILAAGRFSHEGMAFSKDGKQLYLADEWSEGCLYRLALESRQLYVLHPSRGWQRTTFAPVSAILSTIFLTICSSSSRYF